MTDPWLRKEVIGPATLYLGDCRKIVPALRMPPSVVSDPPYGRAFQSGHRTEAHRKISGDGDPGPLRWACRLYPRRSAYLFCRWDNLPDVPLPRSLITWVKPNHSMGDLKHEHGRKTEVALFYAGPDHDFPDGRPADVIFAAQTKNELHPTQKPVSLMSQVVKWTGGGTRPLHGIWNDRRRRDPRRTRVRGGRA